MYKIERAIFPADLDDVLDLYREYIGSTSVDLGFQGNDEEFKFLSDNYSSDESKILSIIYPRSTQLNTFLPVVIDPPTPI